MNHLVQEMLEDDTSQIDPRAALTAALISRWLGKAQQFNTDVLQFRMPAKPTMLHPERVQPCIEAFEEEDTEFLGACEQGDILEAADALIDGIYFRLGRLIEMGIPPQPIFDAVQLANMAKEPGDLAKRPGWNGRDAVKPEGWTPPNHEWLLAFTTADLEELRALRAQATEREALSPIWLELQALREAKGKDYNDVPGGRDAYFPFGHLSYAHMLQTKNLRLQSLLQALIKGRPVNFEGIYDTVKDLVNYATYYAEAMRDGRLSADSLEVKA